MKTLTILCEANPETDKEKFIQLYQESFLPDSVKLNGVTKIQYGSISPVESEFFRYSLGKDIFFSITAYFPTDDSLEAMVNDERSSELISVFQSLGVKSHWFIGVEETVTRYHF